MLALRCCCCRRSGELFENETSCYVIFFSTFMEIRSLGSTFATIRITLQLFFLTLNDLSRNKNEKNKTLYDGVHSERGDIQQLEHDVQHNTSYYIHSGNSRIPRIPHSIAGNKSQPKSLHVVRWKFCFINLNFSIPILHVELCEM